MFMVVILHILGHGGILSKLGFNSVEYHVAYFLETGAYCAVNVFAMITGYLMLDKKFKAVRIISVWVQALFYSVSICLIFVILMPANVGIKDIIKSFMPVTFMMWWYLSAYFILSLFTPIINNLLHSLNKRQTGYLVGIILVFFSVIPTIYDNQVSGLKSGYSMIWLSCMYIIGACIKKYNVANTIKPIYGILGYAGSVFILCSFRLTVGFINVKYANWFLTYLSPIVVLMAVSLLIVFAKVSVREKTGKFLRKTSALSFAVYLIHENMYIRDNYIIGRFIELAEYNWLVMTMGVLLIAAGIFIACIIIEYIRVKLFDAIGIPKLLNFIGNKTDEKLNLY